MSETPYLNPPHGPLRRLEAAFLRRHRPALALALAGLVAQSAIVLPLPVVQGWVLDQVVAGAANAGGLVLLALAAAVGCHLLRLGIGYAVASFMHRISLEAVRDLTNALHSKLQRLPLA